jgi:hypothetical protein
MRPLEGIPGLISASELAHTVDGIAGTQQQCGSFPWPDGHTDPWDHVECALALAVAGRMSESRAAYLWLKRTQRADGSWAMSYDQMEVLDASADANQCGYVAVGLWQWWLLTGDKASVEFLWPTVERALDYVVRLQQLRGDIAWGRDPQGNISQGSLLTGSSSLLQAFRCGVALGELMGHPRPDWLPVAGRLLHAVLRHESEFMDKGEYSMDWYYPILGGALTGHDALERIRTKWDEFVVPGLGVKCVSNATWVTAAESCELALAMIMLGETEQAKQLLADLKPQRREDGLYWTGWEYQDKVHWPSEASSWTAAAYILACDALSGGITLDLFVGVGLPEIKEIVDAECQ